jgi:hypothetical protein
MQQFIACVRDTLRVHLTESLVVVVANSLVARLAVGHKEVRVSLEGLRGELVLLPEIGGEVTIGVGNGTESGLDEVTHGLGLTGGRRVDIADTGELQELLGSQGSDETGTARSWHQTHADRTALTGDLGGHGVWVADLGGTPVATANGHQRQLGVDNGTANGGGDLLGALDTEAQVTIAITDDDEGLEARALTGTSLLLHWHDLHDLILESRAQEPVDDVVLLDWQREEVDLLERVDLLLLDKATELGDGSPSAGQLLFLGLLASRCATTATTSAATATTATTSESTSTSFTSTGRFAVSHLLHRVPHTDTRTQRVRQNSLLLLSSVHEESDALLCLLWWVWLVAKHDSHRLSRCTIGIDEMKSTTISDTR